MNKNLILHDRQMVIHLHFEWVIRIFSLYPYANRLPCFKALAQLVRASGYEQRFALWLLRSQLRNGISLFLLLDELSLNDEHRFFLTATMLLLGLFPRRFYQATSWKRLRWPIIYPLIEVGYGDLIWMMPLLFATAVLSSFGRLLLCRCRFFVNRDHRWCGRCIVMIIWWTSYFLRRLMMQREISKHLWYLCIPALFLRTRGQAF